MSFDWEDYLALWMMNDMTVKKMIRELRKCDQNALVILAAHDHDPTDYDGTHVGLAYTIYEVDADELHDSIDRRATVVIHA